jgi:hypothetical protein
MPSGTDYTTDCAGRADPPLLPGNITSDVPPVPLAVQVGGIPAEMRAVDRWVVWQYVLVGGRWTKVPYIATEPARKASSTNPKTWRSFADALAAYEDGKASGIGFVLGDGFIGGDVDHCIGADGAFNDDALRMISAWPTYQERSVGGDGIHAVGLGTIPSRGRKNPRGECYDKGRFLTVTGRRLPGAPAGLAECSATVADWHRGIFGAAAKSNGNGDGKATPITPRPTTALDLDDTALLDRARSANNGTKFASLWAGDISDYPSHSEADLALCSLLAFWLNRDASRMDRAFRGSGLMRAKWDEPHGAQTYGDGTIEKATAGCREVYSGARPSVASVYDPMPEPAADPEPAPVVTEPYAFEAAVGADHFLSQWIGYASRCTDAAFEYHEAAALTLMAAATPTVRARLAQYPGGLGTNFYGLVIGDSTTSRKSTSKDLARDLLYRVLPSSLCSDAFSPEGFVEQLASRPRQSTCLFVDEFSELLSKLHHAPHMAGMKGLLLTVYGGGSYSYRKHSKRTKAGEKIVDEDQIVDPHLSVLGCTTPAIFESLTEADVLSGLLPRFAIVMPTAKPARRPFFESDDDLENARNHLARWVGRLHAWATSQSTPRVVRFEFGVLSLLDEQFFVALEQAGTAQTDTGRAMLSRLSAMALKLSMLLAAGRADTPDQVDLGVTLDDATAAMTIARRWQGYALAFAARIGESNFERKLQRVLTVVRQHRSVPRHVVAKLAHCDKKTLDSIRDTLVDRGQIVVPVVKADRGRPGEIWRNEVIEGGQV